MCGPNYLLADWSQVLVSKAQTAEEVIRNSVPPNISGIDQSGTSDMIYKDRNISTILKGIWILCLLMQGLINVGYMMN